jgi:hypothetical protein
MSSEVARDVIWALRTAGADRGHGYRSLNVQVAGYSGCEKTTEVGFLRRSPWLLSFLICWTRQYALGIKSSAQ